MDYSFYEYFFSNKDCWFDKNYKYDKYVSDNFSYLLDYIYLANNKPEISDNNMKNIINYIIICDQLPFYIFRNEPKHMIKYHNLVLSYVLIIFNSDIFIKFSDIEKCFIMMPIRHSNDYDNYKLLLDKILQMRKTLDDTPEINRFYKATLKRYSLMENIKQVNYQYIYKSYNLDILDKDCTFKNNLKEPEFNNNLFSIFKDFFENKKYAISLSGGVDSMVCMYIMKYINVDFVAIHINYKNRETSDEEMNLCVKFCSDLNIPIYVRCINEIQRTRDKDRDFYEYITREIRFNFYNLICNNIVLGHNKDDVIENIFSNIMKEKKIDNLFGMDYIKEENNVLVHRPMLNVYKKEIYNFAHIHNIPYLYDSTPSWSERGQKRDKLIPFLNNFDSRIIPGLYNTVSHFNSINKVYKDTIINMIEYKMCKYNLSNGILCVINKQLENYDINIWYDIFSEICKYYSLPYISKKSLENLYKNKNYKNLIILNKNLIFDNYIIKKIL
jgi:tRNA(Ile)-lysidine synthetase-like protein